MSARNPATFVVLLTGNEPTLDYVNVFLVKSFRAEWSINEFTMNCRCAA
jgi:hypothetical protein